jgi:hypothetical protein
MPNHLIIQQWRAKHAARQGRQPAMTNNITHTIRPSANNAACHRGQGHAAQQAEAYTEQPGQSVQERTGFGASMDQRRSSDVSEPPGTSCSAQVMDVAGVSRSCSSSPDVLHSRTKVENAIFEKLLLKFRFVW